MTNLKTIERVPYPTHIYLFIQILNDEFTVKLPNIELAT